MDRLEEIERLERQIARDRIIMRRLEDLNLLEANRRALVRPIKKVRKSKVVPKPREE